MQPVVPQGVSLGLSMGGLVALLFLVANLYVILHLIQRLVAPRSQWAWLARMGKSWHYVHYVGNAAVFVVALVHATLLGRFASTLHWVLIVLLAWMVFAGVTIRFSKASPKFKRALMPFHPRWYMFVAVLLVLIAAHLLALPNFPYPAG